MDLVMCPYDAEQGAHGPRLGTHLLTCQGNSVRDRPPSKPKAKPGALRREEAEARRLEQEVFDPLDPDGLLQCPYDSSHQIRACRFPYHLVKCSKNHVELARKMVTCPFNARHILSREELSVHISSCDDRRCIEPDIGDERIMFQISPSPGGWSAPRCDEDWDTDLQREKATRFCGTPANPAPWIGSMMETNNSLGLRAPKSVPCVPPWKMSPKA